MDEPDERMGEGLFQDAMGPSSALAHLYRGEIHRMKYWRERLDKTTHWAVIAMVGLLTFVFARPTNPHYIIPVGMAAVLMFCGIEARRYRGYDMWRSRVRTLQRNVMAIALDPDEALEDGDWREHLAASYEQPRIRVPFEEALAHRLRRVYLPLLGILLVAWLIRVTAFSTTPLPASAAVGMVPGTAVLAVVGVVYAALAVVALRPRTWHTQGELLETDVREQRA